ncbi:E3 ubiquitin-protein ligase TRIM39-like isoform X1 [Solea solea]|uniref:E3 ubiquitin-protein ligase TRIM39-like isoform X1 n=1 Tax=Solea solea TaxID=90069 RepID=UPI00272B672B|nr:E3 ubiquitin-protein ligase TRIM39-like isoform X1 [Solea solea]XP_058479653.1 E3 ubiquitin-protein ligase TRIM39-like isoform X1 [Solea solea]
MAPKLSEEQFRCSICLDIFNKPTSILCGHNFCLECLKHFWDTGHKYVCPLCKYTFKHRPELRINLVLKEITDGFKRSMKSRPTVKKQRSVTDVPCDVCSDDSTAVKSCVVCKKSFCETHLTPHLRDPVLTMHRLTDPGTFCHLCRNHNKHLGKFCKDDQIPVCVKCTERDHKYHNIVPIEKESNKVKSQVKKTSAEYEQMIEARIKKHEEIKTSVERSRQQKAQEVQTSVQVFTKVISAIERNQALLIEEIEKKQEEAERRAEESVKELEQEIRELERRRSELQALENSDDPLYLLQMFPQMSSPLATRDWSVVTFHSDIHIGQVRKAFSQLVEVCQTLENKLLGDEVDKITQYAVNVTLDPATAAGWLSLSADKKKVSISNRPRKLLLPNEPRRFDSCVSVLGKQSFTSGRHYWVVQVGDKTDWDLGVARESINTKGAITVRPDCGFWAICRRKGGSLSACAGPSVTLNLQETPQKVGIFVDYEEGSVSFFDAEAKSHVYTYSGCTFTEPLYPYFNPCLHDNGKNTAPLVICPVEVYYPDHEAVL